MSRYRTEHVMKALFKTFGWGFWAVGVLVLKVLALVATGAFWLVNGGFGEMDGY